MDARHFVSCRLSGPRPATTPWYAQELKNAGTPIPGNEIRIAALAREHDLPIVARDEHFDRVRGIRRIGW
ncbi:MAG: hypothetical protein R2729_17230 [Bryobacteraceae bacterium]